MTAYFSISEANKILPIVIKKFNFVKKLKSEIMKFEHELSNDMSSSNSLEEFSRLKQKLNSVVTKFYQSIEDLESTGVVLKDLRMDYSIFLQNVLTMKFGFVGKKVKLRLNFGMKRILVLMEENQLV